jgi:hypothetical protein
MEGGMKPVRTRRGTVHFGSIKEKKVKGVTFVEVRLEGETEGGDPNFRIVNPPALVSDPRGDVEINGKRFRHDPEAALAEVIADLGGARKERRRGRRR